MSITIRMYVCFFLSYLASNVFNAFKERHCCHSLKWFIVQVNLLNKLDVHFTGFLPIFLDSFFSIDKSKFKHCYHLLKITNKKKNWIVIVVISNSMFIFHPVSGATPHFQAEHELGTEMPKYWNSVKEERRQRHMEIEWEREGANNNLSQTTIERCIFRFPLNSFADHYDGIVRYM